MATDASTSDKRGQLPISLTLFASRVAASTGSALFFAPCIPTAPFNLCSPSTINFAMSIHHPFAGGGTLAAAKPESANSRTLSVFGKA